MNTPLSKAQRTARNQVGDGKLPNLYWVCASSQYLTNKGADQSNHFDWSGEVYDNHPEKYEIHGPYKTFEGAQRKMNELAEQCPSPRDVWDAYHSVTVEDRLSGTCYEGAWRECWYKKSFQGTEYTAVAWEWEWTDDLSYTKKAMAEKGVEFV